MTAEESLKEGRVQEALDHLKDQIRKDPSDSRKRVFLFQLLCVTGEWDKALNQLRVSGELDPGALAMVQTYREAIRCENLRSGVFAGARSPMVFGDPERWVALLLESLKAVAAEDYARGGELRAEAFEEAPATSGTIDGQSFDWIADADVRLGPVLEAVVNGRYYWVPYHRIRQIDLEEPADLRDSVWMPAHFTWANGGEAFGFVPTRYPGSEAGEDDLVRLARKTDWMEKDADTWLGLGQRMLATDVGEFPLMDVRSIVLATAEEPPGEEEAAGSEAASG